MRALPDRLKLILGGLAVSLVFFGAWRSHPAHVLAPFAEATPPVDASLQAPEPLYSSRFVSSQLNDFVHSSSVTALPGGDLMAVWFAGSREGAADVQIRTARYDANTAEWGAEQVLATRESTRDGTRRYIRKLGNPVIALAPDQRLWMFYVSVSVGGWATSAINVMVSDDFGRNWSVPRQLITSPFFNISTLVRAAPVFHADGSIGLPV
jgi:predicted neuraminidase